jgi:hypothetical protein
MRNIVAAALLLFSTSAMAATFTYTPVHTAPVVHVNPVVRVNPAVKPNIKPRRASGLAFAQKARTRHGVHRFPESEMSGSEIAFGGMFEEIAGVPVFQPAGTSSPNP